MRITTLLAGVGGALLMAAPALAAPGCDVTLTNANV